MKKISRFLAAVLASVMVFTAVPALDAQAADKTVYISGYSRSFGIAAEKAKSIKSMKSTNKSVVKPYYYNLSKSVYVDGNGTNSNSAYAYFQAVKAGKATVSFTADGKKYSQNVIVKNYVNPAKSVKVNGKELVSAFKKGSYTSTSGAKTMKVNAKAAGGWEITSISIDNWGTNGSTYKSRYYSKAVSSGALSFYEFAPKQGGYININFRNKANQGEISLSVSIQSATK
jgi:hypothetical protein